MDDSIRKIIGNRWLSLISRLVLGSIFIIASIGKLQDISRFTDTVADYGILPGFLSQAYGFVLPWTELFIGCSLVLGVFIRLASLLSIPVIFSFVGANVYSFLFDAPDICDCFGKLVTMSHPVSLVIDIVMLIPAGQLLLLNRKNEFLGVGALTQKLGIGFGATRKFLLGKVSVFAAVALAMALVATFASDIQGVIDPDSSGSPEIDLNYSLTWSADPVDGGAVTLSPSGDAYAAGTEIALTAAPAEGYIFAYWSGDLSGSAKSGSITMNSDKEIIAHFSPVDLNYSLTSSVDPVGGGSVTLDPPDAAYEFGTEVILTATPAAGWEFVNWSGDVHDKVDNSDGTFSAKVTMDADEAITAHFTQVTVFYTLTVTVDPPGEGGVEISSPGPYESGAEVTLTATPYSDNTFGGWYNMEGERIGDDETIIITMNTNKTIYAIFDCG